MSEPQSNMQARRRDWRRFVLPASLLLNLFLAALIGGHLLRHEARENSLPVARALANAEASLSPADAAAFRAAMRRDGPELAESIRQVAEARRALGRQIVAEPFDAQATRQALATWQASWNRFFDQMDGSLVEALGKVSPEGRQKLVAERRKARGALAVP